MATDNTERFSNRVADYVKYRPGYPSAMMHYLQSTFRLPQGAQVADVGSGTGISTELFLKEGYTVYAVEPNTAMREKATELLGHYPLYREVAGTAEHTGLPAQSVDVIVAGQAFHWFQPAQTRQEFARILKPNGIVVLVWNERLTASAFESEYDQLIIRHGNDYVQVDHRNISQENIEAFFSPCPVRYQVFGNEQVFDFEGLSGRLLSSSYMPSATDEGYPDMIRDLRRLFDRYQADGHITIHYDTKVFTAELSGL